MTITLLIVFMSIATRTVLVDTVGSLRDKIDMSIYLKTGTTVDQAQPVMDELKQLSSVRSVSYETSEDARANFVQENKNDSAVLETINEATNKFPGTLRVVVQDINDTAQLSDFVDNNKTLKPLLDTNRKPSFAGERRSSIQTIGNAVSFAQKVGVVASTIFVAISILIIFNTIRMAIFNRKEEIQMMKLIGADQSFIRGPFVVEAIVYGFIAAIIATAIGFALIYASKDTLLSYQINVQPTIDFVTFYAAFVLLGMILVGAIIGIISSLLATRRYLRL